MASVKRLAGMEFIFKEGLVYLQGFKFGKRTWRKVWMVLYKPSSTGIGRLEINSVHMDNIDHRKLGRHKAPERKVVRLSDFLSVTPATEESCPEGCIAFYLHTTQCIYTLASTTSQEWLSALCLLAFQDSEESDKGGLERGNCLTMENNELYSSWNTDLILPPNRYQVTVLSTEASRRCKLSGEYLVSPEKEAIILLTCNTSHTVYYWPYRLLRKFGQVEGGFSIEAGHRCQSGTGVFIFLSTRAPEVFQIILEQCYAVGSSSVQPLSIDRGSLCAQSPDVLPTPTNQPAAPLVYSSADVSAQTEDKPANPCSSNDTAVPNVMPLSHISNSREAVRDEIEEEDEQCHSLEALHLDSDMDDNIYYNLRRFSPRLIRKDNSECIYADSKIAESPTVSPHQTFSSPLHHPDPHPPPCSLYPKPRCQRQPHVNNLIQPWLSTQAQAMDDMKEMEGTISSSAHATPTEDPSSFKYRLAEIISKDLAKFQPPLPYGVGSPTFTQ
ncbi:docking protein 3 [Solea senegalensis]|uniref:Docking protein 3 n=1 Tax=Solea senegalensis TaxID=28829 RepID=A0AAV6SL53_SOLSE|nr:docking protein 3 isoform X2 [Solea senegalensis]KAG7518770.1 docking protein 3 [Solea senegalensis]